jgi:UDP-glucose 4-epimerase
VLGDGTQVRDFTYVDDVVDATIAAADGPVEGMAVNIGGGSTVTLNEVIEMLEGLVGHAIDADRVGFARGDVYRTEADLTRAKELLGFNAKVGFFEGLSAEVDWIRDRIEAMEGSLA